MLGQAGTGWDRLVQAGTSWDKLGQAGTGWDRLGHAGTCWTGWDRLGQAGTGWDRLGHHPCTRIRARTRDPYHTRSQHSPSIPVLVPILAAMPALTHTCIPVLAFILVLVLALAPRVNGFA